MIIPTSCDSILKDCNASDNILHVVGEAFATPVLNITLVEMTLILLQTCRDMERNGVAKDNFGVTPRQFHSNPSLKLCIEITCNCRQDIILRRILANDSPDFPELNDPANNFVRQDVRTEIIGASGVKEFVANSPQANLVVSSKVHCVREKSRHFHKVEGIKASQNEVNNRKIYELEDSGFSLRRQRL